MRRRFLALLAALPLLALAQQASYLDFHSAINKAGRQRMLAEFIAKEYLQMALGLAPEAARGQLTEAIWVFDDQLADLKAFASTPELKEAVAAVDSNWLQLREIATAPPRRAQANALRAAARRVLQAAERNVAALERASGSAESKLVGLSGRQRMLSQQMAKNVLLLAGGIDEPVVREDLANARAEFAAGLRELGAVAVNTEEINSQLAAVQERWKALEPMLQRERYDRAAARQVVEATDVILSRMERATYLYQKLAAP